MYMGHSLPSVYELLRKAAGTVSFSKLVHRRTKIWGLAWWHPPVITALRSQRQKDPKFKGSPGYIARSCLGK